MVSYATLTDDGWVRFDDREAWEAFSMELLEGRDMSRPSDGDALDW